MKIILLLLLLFPSVSYADIQLECHPETGNGHEVINIFINREKSLATMHLNDILIEQAENVPFKEFGNIFDYNDEGQLVISFKDGKKVTIKNDFDELILDIKELDLSLSNAIFMCN